MATISILSIGNELLKGSTVNTNMAFIAKEATSRGHKVVMAMEVLDRADEICQALNYSLSKTECVITTGGLGPTFDDMTTRSIAGCFGLSYGINDEALALVKSKLPMNMELSESRLKMAYLPETSTPIQNPVGTAPGMFLKRGNKVILSFPGVPREMESMVVSSFDLIPKSNHSYYQKSVYISGVYESLFSPVVDRLMKYYSGKIYIKSHPRGNGKISMLELDVSSYSESPQEASSLVEKAISDIKEIAVQMGAEVLSDQEIPRSSE